MNQENHTNQRVKLYSILLLGIIGLTFSPFFVTWAEAPGIVTAFYRLLFASLMVLPWFIYKVRQELPLPRTAVLWSLLAGICFAADIAVWNIAVLKSSATNATLFNNTSVFWVALAAWLIFRKRLGTLFCWGLGVAFIGIAIIMHKDMHLSADTGFGDLLAILAGIGYAGFFIAMQHARENLSALTSFFIAALAGALFLSAIIPFTHFSFFGYTQHTYFNFVAMALVTQVIGYLAINYTLGHLPATIVSPSVLLQPLFAASLSMPLLGQPTYSFQIIGGGFVLVGIFMVHRAKSHHAE
jgi:drug/metabolite transporter (DMT)-like permease